MSDNKLDILVLLRESNDPRPPARVTVRGASISERGLRRIPNPADLAALEEALCLKDSLAARVTVLAIGPGRLDDTLRLACSMGADRAFRFWDHGLEGGDAVVEARILARIITILSPALTFSGSRMADRGDDPTPALAAASASIPCISAAVSFIPKKNSAEIQRKSDRGARQVVTAPFPCMVLFEEVRTPRYPSVDAITAAVGASVELWGLPNLGIPFWEVGATGAYLSAADYGVPRPDPVRVVTPDPSLPAFERILSLLSGGIKAREGKLNSLPVDETVTALLRIFREEGLTAERV
ncbi:MAG TPA: electron transfer flavoprotein subunit beta [Desulfuromonadales bacterium]|nr:electron transfer flavoprotein subunit beta [Desulfuromonadales bacterium]